MYNCFGFYILDRPTHVCVLLLVRFSSTLDVVTSMTHRLKVVPRQRFTTRLDGNDVVNHLANSIAFNAQWISFDIHCA